MKRMLAILVNLFIAIVAFAAWLSMVFAVSHGGPLTAGGIFSLKFFTTLSNLFNAFVCLFYAFRRIVRWEPTPRFMTWKLASTAAVGLTFLTVTGFFGPAFGYATMYQGSNFWLHLALPLLSILSFCTLERGVMLPFRATFLALVPMLIYSVGYLGNVLVQGVGEWPHRHDFLWFSHVGLGRRRDDRGRARRRRLGSRRDFVEALRRKAREAAAKLNNRNCLREKC